MDAMNTATPLLAPRAMTAQLGLDAIMKNAPIGILFTRQSLLVQANEQCAAILIVPDGVDFGAIDNAKVTIFFAVIGPKRASGEHLKTLARVSRLLRSREFRHDLLSADGPSEAFQLISREEQGQ